MLCKCHWIVLYTVRFTAFCLGGGGGIFSPDTVYVHNYQGTSLTIQHCALYTVEAINHIHLDLVELSERLVYEHQSREESVRGLDWADQQPTATTIERLVSVNSGLDSMSRQPLSILHKYHH